MADELKPCPFHKDDDCDCYAIIGDTKTWNARPIEDALGAEVAALKAELACYEAPLTDRQVLHLCDEWAFNHAACRLIDAAIREVRKGKKDADSL